MRNRAAAGGLTVNAIAGTHVVTLGFDLESAARAGCVGFAIRREDHTESEGLWLKGMKTFQATDPDLGPGGQVSSRKHPFQTFQWADYSAKPDHDYTYLVVPKYGTPTRLINGDGVSVRITTEQEWGGRHSIFFNRGSAASQEYARRFENKAPDELKGNQKKAAYRWLSRGLIEALLSFIGRAQGASFGLYGAIYEFQWGEVLKALQAAADGGAQVHILYDGIASSSGPVTKNEAAIAEFMGPGLCVPRTVGKLMHNKFLVLTQDDQPVAVWTGSTNLTENGIYGHSNCGHVIEDAAVAAAYLAYWNELRDCTESQAERTWMVANNPNPPSPWSDDLRLVFSPRSGLKVLQWYATIAGGAQAPLLNKPVFMTFAFGMRKFFQKVYEQPDGVLRIALMEKEGNGAGLQQGKIDIRRITALPNVVAATVL
jgi:phospholipase D-like protein